MPPNGWNPHIEQVPFQDGPRFLREYGYAELLQSLGLSEVQLAAYQIPVWVSISDLNVKPLPERAIRIPALLDTGCTSNFSLRQSHLELAGYQARPNRIGRKPRAAVGTGGPVRGIEVFADVWLHSFTANSLTPFPPLRLPFGGHGGILCYPTRPIEKDDEPHEELCRRLADRAHTTRWAGSRLEQPLCGPRLPLLGLRGLCKAGLALEVHCQNKGGHASLFAAGDAYHRP